MIFLKEFGLPARIICEGFSISRAKLYRLLVPSKADPLSSTMAAIAYEHPEYGYRRIHVLLKREGIKVNHKKVYRIYSRLSLQKPVKASRKLKCSKHIHLTTPEYPAHVWSADFLELYLRGRKLRILIVIDDFTRLVVGILVDFSIPASRVLLVIEKSIALYSRPRIFRTDNGSEFIEGRLNRFLSNARIRHEFIEKGKPQQNGFSESFNARFEDECLRMLDLNLMPLKEIKQAIYDWIKEYNCQRPHSSITYETPIRFHILSY